MKRTSIVISGSQGCGKTTLAKQIEEELGIPYKAVETKSLMPEGINSHLDVLKMAVLEPQMGIEFQENLITKRSELFESLRKESFVSDRSVFDSFVYYTLHNSMFDTKENAEFLFKKTIQSVEHYDLLVYLNTNIQDIQGNGVRVTSPYYQSAVNHTLRSLIKDTYSKYYNAQCCVPKSWGDYIDSNLFFAIEDNQIKSPVLFIDEPLGFRYSEKRLSIIKDSLEFIEEFNLAHNPTVSASPSIN